MSPFLLSFVLTGMTALPVVTAVAAELAPTIGLAGRWFSKMWKGYEDAMKRQQGLVSEIGVGTMINIGAVDKIQADAENLKGKILCTVENVEIALDREEDMAIKIVMKGIKSKVEAFTEEIEEVGQNAAKYSKLISQGRVSVLEYILFRLPANAVS